MIKDLGLVVHNMRSMQHRLKLFENLPSQFRITLLPKLTNDITAKKKINRPNNFKKKALYIIEEFLS